MEDLVSVLNERIKYIHTESWGKRGAPEIRLNEDVQQDPVTSRLAGTLEVWVPKRNGEMTHYQSHSLEDIDTLEKIDDLLADVLSKVLADHMNWP